MMQDRKSAALGKTLGYAARLGLWAKRYRVYVLRDGDDRDGAQAAEDSDLRRILRQLPELRRARIAACEDYYGMLIFRVRDPSAAARQGRASQ